MLSLPRPTLAALRTALLESSYNDGAVRLQEAGYAGGEALYSAYAAWLAARGSVDPAELPLEGFTASVSAFFQEIGWGSLVIGSLRDAAVTVDADAWTEADVPSTDGAPSCFVSTGLFADFFGRLAGVPLAVLEVECRAAGASRCRFLVASLEILEAVFEAMGRGEGYEEAISAA